MGGIKEKVLGARRAGVTEILLPAQNGKDLTEIPEEMKEGLSIHLVDHFDQVLTHAFGETPPRGTKKRRKKKAS